MYEPRLCQYVWIYENSYYTKGENVIRFMLVIGIEDIRAEFVHPCKNCLVAVWDGIPKFAIAYFEI